MKSILTLFYFSTLASLVLITVSCNKDDDDGNNNNPPPQPSVVTVSLSASSVVAFPGETVSVIATITSPDTSNVLIIEGANTLPESPISLSGTMVEQNMILLVPIDAEAGTSISVIFVATDSQNNTSQPDTLTLLITNPILEGNLPTQTLYPDVNYLLKGQVFVREGVVLSILPGTMIKGDKTTRGTLIVDRGGKIFAEGTPSEPIVMTSSQPAGMRDRGDWGGLVILGNAGVNRIDPAIEGIFPPVYFGGNPSNQLSSSNINDDEHSGVLRYVRVEFGGIELTPNNETNSMSFGGVGRGTTIEYCQVSVGGDDGFQWFGGTVNAKYLISFAMNDDDFDCDMGWRGNVQYGLAVRFPGFATPDGSNAFECDNGPTDDDLAPYTTGTFSNMTVIGPIKSGASTANGNFAQAIDVRRRAAARIANSVLTGFPRGVRMSNLSVQDQYESNLGYLHNNILAATNNANTYSAAGGASQAFVSSYWLENNVTIEGPASDAIHQSLGLNLNLWFGNSQLHQYPSNPNFAVTSGTLAEGADFNHPMFAEPHRAGFFDVVSFRGAFGAQDWTDVWTEFDPVNAVY